MSLTTAPEVPAQPDKQAEVEPHRIGGGLLDPKMLWKSLPDAFKKLDPRVQFHNPVMFVVEVGAVLTTYSAITKPVGVRLDDHRVAVADRGVRQPVRGGGRGPRQGAGRHAAAHQAGDRGPAADRLGARPGERCARRRSRAPR